MKVFGILFFVCIVMVAPVQAIPSALNQSIITMQTILSSPLISSVITQNEAIVGLEFKGNKGVSPSRFIVYEIKTEVGDIIRQSTGSSEEIKHQHNYYKVELSVLPNPLIGPPIMEVVSIKYVSKHAHFD